MRFDKIANIIGSIAAVYSIAAFVIYYFAVVLLGEKWNNFFLMSTLIIFILFSLSKLMPSFNKKVGSVYLLCSVFFTAIAGLYAWNWIFIGIPKVKPSIAVAIITVVLTLMHSLYVIFFARPDNA
jgi:hypothetical protein